MLEKPFWITVIIILSGVSLSSCQGEDFREVVSQHMENSNVLYIYCLEASLTFSNQLDFQFLFVKIF